VRKGSGVVLPGERLGVGPADFQMKDKWSSRMLWAFSCTLEVSRDASMEDMMDRECKEELLLLVGTLLCAEL